jgi:hypothetical protein
MLSGLRNPFDLENSQSACSEAKSLAGFPARLFENSCVCDHCPERNIVMAGAIGADAEAGARDEAGPERKLKRQTRQRRLLLWLTSIVVSRSLPFKYSMNVRL